MRSWQGKMARGSHTEANPGKDEEIPAATPDLAAGETPMTRFKSLTRRLLRVSPDELGKERARRAGEKKKDRS
jgi:hypothetical protein